MIIKFIFIRSMTNEMLHLLLDQQQTTTFHKLCFIQLNWHHGTRECASSANDMLHSGV